MVKKSNQLQFVCKECGNEYSKWTGQCLACGAWNSLKEVQLQSELPSKKNYQSINSEKIQASKVVVNTMSRFSTGWGELDRILGGDDRSRGLVSGSVILLTGEPGIGKSTLLSQLAMNFAGLESIVLYVSGEESIQQVGLRMQRLAGSNVNNSILDNIEICSTSDLDEVVNLFNHENIKLMIVDSIQTIQDRSLAGGVGSVAQIKECAMKLILKAKEKNIPLVLVGHVTKDGSIAGPRLLEHMVDVVLTFEGDKQSGLRILRSIKNRFGPTDEVGVFVMDSTGLNEENNPSNIFVSSKSLDAPGSVLCVAMEGTRPFVVEIQALISNSQMPNPRRVVTGYDYNRVVTIVAILIQRCGMRLETKDIYVNIVGGIRLEDSGVDLAIAVAIASSLKSKSVNNREVFVGELGLVGEIRIVRDIKLRVREALRLGYHHVNGPIASDAVVGHVGFSGVRELIEKVLG